jgi:6-phosphogluconolactonase (cycloisomerase 2 family)
MFRTSRILLTLSLALASYPLLSHAQDNRPAGAVFVMTNNATKNEVITHERNSDGSLMRHHHFATGGRGSGGINDPLGSQGSLTLTTDHSFLLAVNAGSGDISVFRVNGPALKLVSLTPCGGSEPVAVAQHGNLVYVVNAGGMSNVTGFHLTNSGELRAIPHSTVFLTTANSGPGSIAFSPTGRVLLVAEKITGNIDGFPVHANGTLGALVATPSAGPGLFGVLFAPNGTAIATETGPVGGVNASAVSSYSVSSTGALTVISANVPTLANATCWNVVTPNDKFMYTTNPGSGTLSGFSISSTGGLTPIDGTVLATLPADSSDLDLAITDDGKYLYTIDSGTGSVSILAVRDNGTLDVLPGVSGLPANAGFNGLAAF